jgi:protein subunit release factor A
LIEDVPPKSRENRADPAIYIYNSDEGIDRFSANTSDLEETTTIRLDVWTLAGATEAKAYRDDIVNTFKQYMRDNYNRTEFLDIEPSDAVDIRQTKISRQTDHYIYSVELEFERLA